MKIREVSERFDRETKECGADGSALQGWVEAREIPLDELKSAVAEMLGLLLLDQIDPPSLALMMFRLGYESAVAKERESVLD